MSYRLCITPAHRAMQEQTTMNTVKELQIAQSARRIIELARDNIAAILADAGRDVRALQMSARSQSVIESLDCAATALEGDEAADCIAAIERILTDELTSDTHLETLVEEEQGAIAVDPFDACRALSDEARATILVRS